MNLEEKTVRETLGRLTVVCTGNHKPERQTCRKLRIAFSPFQGNYYQDS